MKKVLLVLVVVFLTGCGKKLTCTYNEIYEDVEVNNKIVFDFKNNKYKEIDIMKFKEIKEAEDYFDDIKDYIEEFNLTLDGNRIISNIEGKIDSNKKSIKEKYESYDFKCK